MEVTPVSNNGRDSPTLVDGPFKKENSRTSTSPFVSNRLQAYQRSVTVEEKKSPSEFSGRPATLASSISQRMLAFENSTSSTRASIISPTPIFERRSMRVDWIKKSSTVKVASEDEKEILKADPSSSHSVGADRRVSQARFEMPKLLAHVNVLQRASQYLSSDSSTRESGSRGNSATKASMIMSANNSPRTIPEESTSTSSSAASERPRFLSQKSCPTLLWQRVESPERSRALESLTFVPEDNNQEHSSRKGKDERELPQPFVRTVQNLNFANAPMRHNSHARSEIPTMLAHVKVSERASRFTLAEEDSKARTSKNRDEVPALLAHVKVSERASVYVNNLADNDKVPHAPSETCKSFVVAQNKFVVTSRRASSGTFSTTVGQNNMCLLCDKVVHNMEIVISGGGVWHKSCFTCGALSDLGCNRVLITPISPDYFHHFGCPFCHGCTNKIFMHGELHIFPSGPEECSPADTPYDQRSPSKESSLAPYEENHKAKKAYRNRVRAGVSQPHSPVEYPDNDYKKFDVENMTINHTFLFSEIYKDRTDGPDGGEVTVVEAKNTEKDEYSGVENTSTQDYTALNYVLSRLQMLENIRIKEAKEARDEYFHRFDNAVDNVEVEVEGHNDTAIEMSCTVLGEDSLLPLESASVFAMNLPLTPASSFAFPPTSTSTSTYATPIIALADPFGFEVEQLDDITASTTASTVTAASSANAVSRELNEVHNTVENNVEEADMSMSSQVGMIEELDEGRVLGEGEGDGDMRQYTSSNGSSSKSTPSKLIKGLRPSLNVSSTKTETGIRRKKKDGEENEIDDDDDEEEEESIESNWSDKETSNPTDVHMTERNNNNDSGDGEYDDKQNINKSFESESDQHLDQDKNSNKEIKSKNSKDSGKQSGKEYETISEKIRRKKSLTKKKEIQSVYHEIFEKKYDDNEIVSESISEKIQRNKSIHKKKEIQSVYHEIFEKKFDEVNTEKLLKKKQKTDSFILPVLWKF